MSAVLVVIKADTCGHCKRLTPLLPEIFKNVKKEFPDVEIQLIEMKSMDRKDFDTKKYPQGLMKYLVWFPMILLIPTSTWEKNGDMEKGVQIMSGKWDNNKIVPDKDNMYNFMDSEQFNKWINFAIDNKHFTTPKGSESNPLLKANIDEKPEVRSSAVTLEKKTPTKKSVQIITGDNEKMIRAGPVGPVGQCKINMVSKK